ncbi:MAG TPA: serine/threonine protein kinase, partial [Mycobacterium sp.]|nr:serine/threonine protein kinase [Mycobacterium sp.]
GKPYGFQPRQLYALDANAIICANQSPISGAHSDIRHPEVLWAVMSAAGLT